MHATLRNRLGTTDLDVFPICLGGNPFGWTADESASFAILDAYWRAGGNFIDTADEYSDWVDGNQGGESEAIIGRWMQARQNRHEIVLVSKVGLHHANRGLSRNTILTAIDGSLRRLQTDHVDLYYAHADDPNTPQEQSLAAFDQLVKAGKVRHLGASNYRADRLTQALAVSDRCGIAVFAVLQPHYNLIDRSDFEGDLMSVCEMHGIASVPFQGLAMGFLSGKYRLGGPTVASAREPEVKDLYMNERGYAALGVLEEVAVEVSASMGTVALAWLLTRPTVATPLASASSASQISALVAAAHLTLSEDQLNRLTEAV